jgi:hypothetical protein
MQIPTVTCAQKSVGDLHRQQILCRNTDLLTPSTTQTGVDRPNECVHTLRYIRHLPASLAPDVFHCHMSEMLASLDAC